jgi:hypothetical protein
MLADAAKIARLETSWKNLRRFMISSPYQTGFYEDIA